MEKSCPWLNNCVKKDSMKPEKYQPLRWDLTKQYPGYKIIQLNVIMDVLVGWSKELDVKMSKIFGARLSDIVKRIKKGVLSSSLNIARSYY